MSPTDPTDDRGEQDVEALRRQVEALREEAGALRRENARLAEQTRSYEAFIHAHPDLGFVFDSEGRYLRVIASQEQLLYAGAEKLLGRRFHDLYPPQEAQRYLDTVLKTLQTGRSQTMEYEMTVPAGRRWFEGRTFPVEPSIAELPTVVWISRDVTERKAMEQDLRDAREQMEARVLRRTAELEQANRRLQQLVAQRQQAEQALRESEQLLRSLVANVPGALFRTAGGFEPYIEMMTGPVEQLTGVPADEWIGESTRAWQECVDPADVRRCVGVVDESIRTGQPYELHYRIRIRGRDGRIRWVEERSTPIYEDDGSFSGLAGVILDVTRRREAEQAVEEFHRRLLSSQEELRRSLARDLHDSVGQKLVVVMLAIRSLLGDAERHLASDEARHALEDLSTRCGELIRELRGLCHGLYPPLLEERGLILPLQSLVTMCRESGFEADFAAAAELAEQRFGHEAEIALYRVAQEGVSNALSHSGGTRVEIRLERDDDWLLLTVTDDGKGIDGDDGEGLGMRTMRDRLASIGGTFEIDSGPGGTRLRAAAPAPRE